MDMHAMDREKELKDYLWVVYKYRKVAFYFFVSVVMLVGIYSFTARPQYMATTRIYIERTGPNIVDFKEIYAIDAKSQDFYQTQYKILESRFIATEVLTRLGLWNNPAFVRELEKGELESLAPEERDNLERSRRERAINRFQDSLVVQPIRNTEIVEINFKARDPQMAAHVANAVVKAYIGYSLTTRLVQNVGATDFLAEKIAEQRNRIEDSEKLLQEYKERYGIISLEEEEKITASKLSNLSSDLLKAENERIDAESRYRVAASIIERKGDVESIPDVMGNSFIAKLRTDEAALQAQLSEVGSKYGDKHPQVISLREKLRTVNTKIGEEVGSIVGSLRNRYEIALAKEHAIKGELAKLRGESQALGVHTVAYGVLWRDVQANKQMYDVLLTRIKQTGITTDIQATNVRVLDMAQVPIAPFKPNKKLNIALAFFVGLVGGVALALFLEHIDNTIKTQDDIEHYIGIPYLGPVPEFSEQSNMKGEPFDALMALKYPKSIAAEAYRSIRTSIIFSSPDERKTLLVTSSNPSEGKSITSANLAITMAQNGARTLLVDVDFRKPMLHRLFGIPQEKGLSNFLVADAELDEIIVNSKAPNLDIIPSGHIPPNPSELLSSESMRHFVSVVRDRYDRIIFDSPPINSATDPVILSTYIEEVVLVIRMGEASRDVVRTAVGRLEQVKANLLGSVLNCVKTGHGNYYYQYYYGDRDQKSRKHRYPKLDDLLESIKRYRQYVFK